MDKEKERVLGVRRERIYYWNDRLFRWDAKKEKVLLKDDEGNEIAMTDTEQEEREDDID